MNIPVAMNQDLTTACPTRMRSIAFQFHSMPLPGIIEGATHPSTSSMHESVIKSSCGMYST
jgi:hypothetical protein